MVRLQVQLDQAQHRLVKQRARRLGISVSELIRRGVALELKSSTEATLDDRARRALAVVGRYREPAAGQIASQHDAALTEAYRR
jgi:hypothetical protein